MFVYEVRKGKNGICYVVKTVAFHSLQTLAAVPFPTRAMLSTKKTQQKESRDCSRMNFDGLNCCVCEARPTAFTTLSSK